MTAAAGSLKDLAKSCRKQVWCGGVAVPATPSIPHLRIYRHDL